MRCPARSFCTLASARTSIADEKSAPMIDTFPFVAQVIRQGQVAGAGTQVENGSRAHRWDHSGRPPAPVVIDVKAQQMIEQIVARRDVIEHPADAFFSFV